MQGIVAVFAKIKKSFHDKNFRSSINFCGGCDEQIFAFLSLMSTKNKDRCSNIQVIELSSNFGVELIKTKGNRHIQEQFGEFFMRI